MNQQTSAPGSSLLPDSIGTLTSAHFVVIAIFAALVLVGLLWGARLKARRKAAERDVIEHNRQLADTTPDAPRQADARPLPVPAFAPIVAANDSAANDGAADGSLMQLKGLGPKVADRLAELGVTSVGQIAALSDDDAVRLDDQLGPFRGRMMRDRWIEQARFLAAGDKAGFESVFGRL